MVTIEPATLFGMDSSIIMGQWGHGSRLNRILLLLRTIKQKISWFTQTYNKS